MVAPTEKVADICGGLHSAGEEKRHHSHKTHTDLSIFIKRRSEKNNRKTLFVAASNEMRWVGSPQTAHPGELLVAAVPVDPHSSLQQTRSCAEQEGPAHHCRAANEGQTPNTQRLQMRHLHSEGERPGFLSCKIFPASSLAVNFLLWQSAPSLINYLTARPVFDPVSFWD